MRIEAEGTLESDGKAYGEELRAVVVLHPGTPYEHDVLAALLEKNLGPTVRKVNRGNLLQLEIALPAPPAEPEVKLRDEDFSDEDLRYEVARCISQIRWAKRLLYERQHLAASAPVVRAGLLTSILSQLPSASGIPGDNPDAADDEPNTGTPSN